MPTIHRAVIGVAYRPARRSRPTYGPWTRARGASRRSGQPDPTHGRWTVGAPRVGSCVALGDSRRRTPSKRCNSHMAALPETGPNIALSGRFAW